MQDGQLEVLVCIERIQKTEDHGVKSIPTSAKEEWVPRRTRDHIQA